MRKKKKTNNSRIFGVLLLGIILVCVIILAIKNNGNQKNEIKLETIQTQGEATDVDEQNNTTAKKDNKIDLNNLAEDEASFGKLDEQVYKINEKNIKLPLLIYHGFCTPIPDDDVYKLMCSQDIFEDQIKTLKDAGYTFITLEDMYKYKQGKIGLPEKNVTITMDDGWEGNYTEAFDLLKKYNIPATIFIVEDLVGTTGYFTWEQAKEMYDSGLVKIHVHGRHHTSATKYNKAQLIEDYNHAHNAIEDALEAKIKKIMAYPAGDSSQDTITWLKEAGFEIQVQTKYGTVNKSSSLDLTGLGRIRAERASGASILKAIEAK